MSKIYTLAVANTLIVPVSFKVADGAKTTDFSFTLTMARQSDEEWNTGVCDEKGNAEHKKIKKHLREIASGWKDQKFVMDENGAPAEFCPEAFDVMLASVGVADVILTSYMKENSAKVKNS